MTVKYYLRIEGVNLSNFVYDTNDLSTIRGGGLRLLNSIEEIKNNFSNNLISISTGASSGLFEIKSSSLNEAKGIKQDIEKYFNSDPCLKHATFVIDILKSDGGNFKEVKEKLLALNRWRQMQSPSIAVPSQNSQNPCRIDMVRPANKTLPKYKKKTNVPVSESVYHRREYGRNKKQQFYKDASSGITSLPEFVYDFDELTNDPLRGNLHHKMAVIYIDGNGFGKIQEDTKTPDELKKWDNTIKNYRGQMLTDLLNQTISKPEWTNGGRHRMETLLWGGDELIWIVPAWVGWWTLDFFYQKSNRWKFNSKPLTHSSGIVFCHHNAPIYRITRLTNELAGVAKEKSRDKNLFVYQKLESFDHLGKDFNIYVRDVYNNKIQLKDLVLNGEDMAEIKKHIITLKENDFSRSRLHKIVQCIISGKGDYDTLVKKAIKNKDIAESLKNLTPLLNGEQTKWFHIAELWDYITA